MWRRRQGRPRPPSSKPSDDWRKDLPGPDPPLHPHDQRPHGFRAGLRLPPRQRRTTREKLLMVTQVVLIALFVYLKLYGEPNRQPTAAPAGMLPSPPAALEVVLTGSGFIAKEAIAPLATAWMNRLKLPGVHIVRGPDPSIFAIVGGEPKIAIRVRVHITDDSTALAALLRNQADFWMLSRPVEDTDLAAVAKQGLPNAPPRVRFRQPGTETRFASAALVLLVHPDNPVQALSPLQVNRIFAGQTTAWAQVGGPTNQPVGRFVLTARREETAWFCRAFMNPADPASCMRAFGLLVEPPLDSPRTLAQAVAASPAAIGYATLGERGATRIMGYATRCGTAIQPGTFRIKSGEYPLISPLFLYAAPTRPLSRAAKAFLDFILSAPGQDAIAAAGLTNIVPAPDRDDPPTHTRDATALAAATTGAERLSVTVRFAPGKAALDPEAQADVARLVAWTRQPGFAKIRLQLFGFTESSEPPTLGIVRAEAVRTRMQAEGLAGVTATGMGAQAPVGCESDPVTAAFNRRVEVWIPRGR
jgi:phosphate transport system substrate-binding protein